MSGLSFSVPPKNDFRAPNRHVRSGWNESAFILRGQLTDRQIDKYQQAGWYSEDYRKNRREFQARRQEKRLLRDGSFLKDGGRLIYSP
jgi:hypothetical protein